RVGIEGIGRMDLVQSHQPRAGRDGGDGEAAILHDRRAVVARAEPDIQPRAEPRRDSAPPSEKAVRDARERAGAVHLDVRDISHWTGLRSALRATTAMQRDGL